MSSKTLLLILIAVLVLIPLATAAILPHVPALRPAPDVYSGGKSYPDSPRPFESQPLGDPPAGLPVIANLQIVDFDGDGANDIIACDASRNRMTLLTRNDDGDWNERTLVDDVAAPAHATVVDLDGDGDLDIVASVLGNILPDDGVIGRVELFENSGEGFVRHVLLDDVRRVADVQPGDFDGDSDLDLAVAVFGYNRGEVLWLENRGNFQFRDHRLLNSPGTVHVPVGDFDGDGDLDIVAIVTQDEEELWGFENMGGGEFSPRLLWTTPNYDLGSAGLVQADLDGDGDLDLILPAGDNLEDMDAYPQPYHGCYWFENQGDWKFDLAQISDLGGTYAADVGDLDGDGDLDVVLVSMTNDFYAEGHASVVWLENDGLQTFQTWQIASRPIHLVTLAVGDLDGDGTSDIVAGGLHLRKPFRDMARITGWFQRRGGTP